MCNYRGVVSKGSLTFSIENSFHLGTTNHRYHRGERFRSPAGGRQAKRGAQMEGVFGNESGQWTVAEVDKDISHIINF